MQALPNAARLAPQKLDADATPHVTIETNTTCNIRCAACYAVDRPVVKSLDAIRGELDYAAARRRLDTVSLLGGEPTLHPWIADIVRDVKQRGYVCQILTNGVAYLRDGDADVYRRIVDAGVDRILVHVDSGQAHVHGDVDAARERMFALLDELNVWYGLTLTLYRGEEGALPALLRGAAPHRRFDGALVTLAMDFERVFTDAPPLFEEPDLAAVATALREELHVEPAAYLPTNVDDDEVAWLMWFYWINVRSGATVALSPELNRAMKALHRLTHPAEFFAAPLPPDAVGRTFAESLAADVALHPSRLGAWRRVAADADHGRALRLHYLVVQQAPRIDPADGRLHFCWHCPDATVRHGRLVPVCLASRLDPLDGRPPSAPDDVVTEVYQHLGEPRPDRRPASPSET